MKVVPILEAIGNVALATDAGIQQRWYKAGVSQAREGQTTQFKINLVAVLVEGVRPCAESSSVSGPERSCRTRKPAESSTATVLSQYCLWMVSETETTPVRTGMGRLGRPAAERMSTD